MTHPVLLCATDFSEASSQALAKAVDLARGVAGRVLVVHVASEQGPCIEVGRAVVHLPIREGRDRTLQRLAQIASSVADLPVEARVVAGDAAEEILRLAREHHCAGIVLGGRSGKNGMGRVAERIIRSAPCPVLVAFGTAESTVTR